MDHSVNHKREYVKFVGVLVFITALAWWHAIVVSTEVDSFGERSVLLMQFLESFMGVFFVVFAAFKLYNLREFAYSFQTYEVMKNRSVAWGYVYPFVQIAFGLLYVFSFGSQVLDGVVFVWSALSSYVVALTLRKKGDIHCVCLGNVIRLPLSTMSFVEDFGMSVMALVMLVLRS